MLACAFAAGLPDAVGVAVEGWIARGWAAAFSCSEEREGRPEG